MFKRCATALTFTATLLVLAGCSNGYLPSAMKPVSSELFSSDFVKYAPEGTSLQRESSNRSCEEGAPPSISRDYALDGDIEQILGAFRDQALTEGWTVVVEEDPAKPAILAGERAALVLKKTSEAGELVFALRMGLSNATVALTTTSVTSPNLCNGDQ